jgi:hypothetical protein
MSVDADWRTLREIDEQLGLSKGSAFRVFKRIKSSLIEGLDFQVLQHERDQQVIEDLRGQGRIYGSSINIVLLSAGACERLLAALIG